MLVPLECDLVIYDEEAGSYLAACHLIQHGHRALGIIEHGAENPGNHGHPHLRGLQRALRGKGCNSTPNGSSIRKFLKLVALLWRSGCSLWNSVPQVLFSTMIAWRLHLLPLYGEKAIVFLSLSVLLVSIIRPLQSIVWCR